MDDVTTTRFDDLTDHVLRDGRVIGTLHTPAPGILQGRTRTDVLVAHLEGGTLQNMRDAAIICLVAADDLAQEMAARLRGL